MAIKTVVSEGINVRMLLYAVILLFLSNVLVEKKFLIAIKFPEEV